MNTSNHNQDRYISDKVLNELIYVGIDFDDTIARKVWPDPGIGDPMPGVEAGFKAITDMGFKIHIFTARPYSDIKPINNWLKDHNLKQYVDGIICGKPLFKLFIDDSAIGFSGDWNNDIASLKNILGKR